MRFQHDFLVGGVAALFVFLSACSGGGGSIDGDTNTGTSSQLASSPSIQVLSNRADLLSGDDVLVEVLSSAGAAKPAVLLNGSDVSAAFEQTEAGYWRGLVTGLKLGKNTLTAKLPSGDQSAELINHPNGGPIFSGPQVQPWVCQEGALDAQCNQPAEYSFLYKSSNPLNTGLQPYDPESPAGDVASTTTDEGVTLPFIVRLEKGYQDRDQYKIFTLFDPEASWTATAPQEQWNGKLLVTHGGNCGAAHAAGNAPTDDYAGTIPANPALEQSYITALGKGYSVMSTALDNAGHNCNIAVQAESLMMGKERFIEQYGPLRYTIGTGCSGGSIVQFTLANAYPGIYQGILAMCSYPDVMGAAAQFTDYHLLRIYFEDPSRWGPILWSPTQFADVEGHISHVNAVAADEGLYKAALNPANPCSGVSDEERFDQDSNPGGVRCDVLSYVKNLLGPRPPEVWTEMEQNLGHGFTGLPVSTVGIQYGLNALRSGLITPIHFVELNTRIGGLDVNFNWVPERIRADEPAISNVYRTGMSNMADNMDTVAMINFTGNDPGIAHDTLHAFWVRWRLDRAQGHHDNFVMWGGPAPLIGDPNFVYLGLDAMSAWLDAVEADTSNAPLAAKILSNKPADVHDACSNGLGQFILDEMCPEPVVTYFGTPRTVAGDDIYGDSLACQLKPFSRDDDYGPLKPLITEGQWQQLEELFAEGVCDYSKPPMSQQATVTWQTYADDKGDVIYGGTALPKAPKHSGQGWAAPAFQLFSD